MSKLKDKYEVVLDCAERGLSYAETARLLGVDSSAISHFSKKHGIFFKGLRKMFNPPKEDIEKIIAMYENGCKVLDIKEDTGYSYQQLARIFKSNNIETKGNATNFTNAEVSDICNRYLSGESALSIAKVYNCTIKVIKRLVIKNTDAWDSSSYQKEKRGVEINTECFKNFETEEELYYYGLLLADGCVTGNKNRIQLTLKDNDLETIENFKRFLGSNNKVSVYKNSRGISFTDKKISEKLMSVGFKQRKTLSETVPLFYKLDNLNMRHFWRGFVDGDGSVLNSRTREVSLIGTFEMVTEFVLFCNRYAECRIKTPHQHKRVNKNCYTVKYHGEDATNIARLLYSNNKVSMDRKNKTAQILITTDFDKQYFERLPSEGRGGSGLRNIFITTRGVRFEMKYKGQVYTKAFSKFQFDRETALFLAKEYKAKIYSDLGLKF